MRLRSVAVVLLTLLAIGLAASGLYWRLTRPAVLRLPGVVEIQEIKLASKIGGRVKEVFIREGDLVQGGVVLMSFEAPELTAQRRQCQARLEAAEADLDRAKNGARYEEREAAREAVEAARARWERLKAGAREEEIRQARAELASADADLKLARLEFTRVEQAFSQRASSRADYDQTLARRDHSASHADAARAHLDLLLAGSRPEEIAEAAAEMRRCQANYELLQAGTRSEEIEAARARVHEVRARLQELDALLDEATIRAPGPAVVEVLAVRPGDVVGPNQAVLQVLRAEDLWVKVYVPETDLGRIRLQQEVQVKIDAYPGQPFTGTVTQIASASEFTPRNVQSVSERRYQVFGVKVQVSAPPGVFKSGIAAEVVLPLDD
jgi:multidrug resistance efflux pump